MSADTMATDDRGTASEDGGLVTRSSPPTASLYVAVFLISAAVLIFEIGLTRIFSVLLRFHFVFLAVSCAICGLGLGGMLSVSASRVVRQRLADGTVLAGLALALGV
ncbi:MAG TPA: hypothetical protein PLQ54_02440, partial [Armatimonadota bacterium]|nr:hypothetical protein [Armatimonadota bacterium]